MHAMTWLITGLIAGLFVGCCLALWFLIWLDRKDVQVRPVQKLPPIPRAERRPTDHVAHVRDIVTAEDRLRAFYGVQGQ